MIRVGVALTVALAAVIVLSGWAGTVHFASDARSVVPLAVGAIRSDAIPVPVGAKPIPLPPSSRVVVTLSLAPSHPEELSRFLAGVEDSSSPSYRHFLTHAEFVRAYAPSTSSAEKVFGILQTAGGRSIYVYPDRSAVSAVLTPSEVRSLFGVQLVEYGRVTSSPLYTATGVLSVPTSLRGLVVGVNGLSNEARAGFTWNLAASHASAARIPERGGEFVYNPPSGSQWFVGSDYTQVFGATQLFPGTGSVPNATFPQKVAIATLLAGSYNNTTHLDLPPWDPAVVNAYFNTTFPATWPVPSLMGIPVTIGGVTPPLPGSLGNLNDSTADEYENSLDLEMAGSLAPGASLTNFYFAGSLLAMGATYSSLAGDFAQSLAVALAFNYSPARLAVVSGSFGLPDLNDSTWDFESAAAAAMGVTLVISSGDQGNAPDQLTGRTDGQWPTWPGSATADAWGSIAAGGVSMTIAGVPTTNYSGNGPLNLEFDSNLTGISGTTAWYDNGVGGGQVAGTEGGISTVYPEPFWQFDSAAQPAIVNVSQQERISTGGRAEPDLAMPGNTTIATVFANTTGTIFFTVLEGTSVAAPVLAGLLADIVAVESNSSSSGWAPLGFFTPEIYRIASYYAAYPSIADPFFDVTTGQNYVFSAGSGWDALTGWGTVNAPRLLAADENSTVRGYQYHGPTPGFPTPSSTRIPWSEIYIIFGVGIVVALVLVVLMARPSRPRGPVGVPFGAQGIPPAARYGTGVQGGIYPGATFLCPYCGAVRPAEPVRCPQCGAF